MADEFVPVALAEEEEAFTPVALADEESDFTPVGFADDEQPIDTRRIRGEAFKMLNDAGRLSPRLQRDVADESSGIVGGTLRAGKNVLGGIAETIGEAVTNPFTRTEAFTLNSIMGEATGGNVADDLKEAAANPPAGSGDPVKTKETLANFVKFFEGNGITDGKQMMEVLKDSIRENTWDPTTDDNARVLSDGSLRVNPKFVALPDAQAGIDAIMAAPVDDETRQQEVANFKAARKTAAAALDTKTKAFDEDYRAYAAAQAAKGITDPEQVFYGWPGLDRNWIESSWDVVRDTVAEAGRGTAQTARGVVAGVGEKLGLEGLVEGVGREMLASSEKSGFVKEIATARGQEGAVVSTGKDLGNTVLQMVPMFVGAGVGRVVAGAAEAGTAKRILGNITAGTSVYGYAGAQGYSSIMQTALDSAQRDAEAQGRELTGAEINATVEKFQGAALANGLQTAVLAKLLPEGAEKAALNGLAAQAGQMTGRDVFTALRAKYGQDGVRAAVMAAKPELVEFAKQAYRAGKVGFKDEAIEEGVNQFLEGTIVKMSGADPDKTWDQIGQETWTGAWMGGVIGGGLPVATKTLAKTDPADVAARQLAAGAQTAAPAAAEAAMEPLDSPADATPNLGSEPAAGELSPAPIVEAGTSAATVAGETLSPEETPNLGSEPAAGELSPAPIVEAGTSAATVAGETLSPEETPAVPAADAETRNPVGVMTAEPLAATDAEGAAGEPVTTPPRSKTPSKVLPPKATENAPPRPPEGGGREGRNARIAWSDQYEFTHNPDGTPIQPTLLDETVRAAQEAGKLATGDLMIDAVGVFDNAGVSIAVEQLLDAGWNWNGERMENPDNPAETPASGLARIRAARDNAKKPTNETTPLPPEPAAPPVGTPPAEAPVPAPISEHVERLVAGGEATASPSATPTETQQLVALDEQIEQDLEPPIPEPEFNATPLPPDQSPTSIKHAQVDADRERMGLPPRFRRPPYTDQAAWDRAIAAEDAWGRTNESGTAGSALLDRLIREGPRALTKDESALLLHEKLLREDAVEKAQAALNRAGADGRLELQGRVKAAMESFRNLADYVDAAGNKSGLSLQARKMLVNRDYSLASVAREMHAAKNLNAKEPVQWTDADQKKAAEVAKKLQETQARLEQVTEENTELTAAVERLTRDVEQAQAKLGKQVRETKVRKLVKEKLDPLVAEARARLEARGKIRPSEPLLQEQNRPLGAGLQPEDAENIRDLAIVGAGWLIDKALTVSEFGAKMVATFGDWAKDHIDAVFSKSQSLFTETAASVSGGNAPTPEQVRDSIDPEEELTRQDVWELARAHVIAGARGRNVLENVFNDLSPLFPDLTRDRVAELFTDYGKTTRPSQNETAKELQRVKSLERIALKLADVRAGRMPKRTGFQRGDQDAEIRELEKQFREEYRALEEAMRAKGIPFEDSERRLKTALGAVKRRMLNEIEEIERAIASGEARNAAVRQPVQYDQEAIDLRARLEAKRAEYDTMFSKETTREKRVAAAIKSLDRQIAAEAKMLADGILKKAKGETINSPEIETRREQLRQMRQNRRDLYAAQNPGQAEADALAAAKKAAQKAIERLGAAVASGDVAVKKKDPAYTPDAELTALVEARETLSDMVAEMRRALPATPEREAAREKRMLAAAEKTLEDVDAKLAAGDLSVKAAKTAAAIPASVQAVREKIKSANRQLDARRREAGVGPYSMDAKIQRQLSNVNKRLAEYQRRIREQDFTKKTPAKPVTSAEILDAEFEAAKAKAEYQEMLNEFKLKNATFGKKAGYYLFSTNNLLKLLTLGFDIGVLTRQLGTTYQSIVRDMGMFAPTAEGARLRADGSYVLRTIRAGARAFSDPRKELDIYKAVSTRPNAGWDKAAGLVFGAPFDDQAGTREDVPTANFIEQIPWWVWPAIAGAKVALVGVSPPVAALLIGTSLVQKRLLIALDRAQRAMTNQSRALWFDHAMENLPETMQTAESAKVLGTAVMVGTGRGVLPKSMEGMVPAANMILLATRFYISRIQSLLYGLRTAADVGTGFLATPKATKAARQEVAKMYARSVTGRALLLMLAAWGFGKSLGGDDEEDKGVVLDPFNPDFGRVKLGEKTKLDFMSGINGFMGIMLRTGFKQKTDPATGRKEVLSPTDLGREVTNFFASKRNLQVSFLWNTHKGEYYGGKAVNFQNALEEATTAIIVNDTVNAFKELGPVKGAALTMLMLTGAGTSVGDAAEEDARRKADKAAANLERKRREAALNQ